MYFLISINREVIETWTELGILMYDPRNSNKYDAVWFDLIYGV
jgi:hypothetical protein